MTFHYPIDENAQAMLSLELAREPGHVRARVFGNETLIANLLPLLTLGGAGGAPVFDLAHGNAPFDFKINGQVFARFTVENAEVRLQASPRRLSVFETRVIGRSKQRDAPYPLARQHYDDAMRLTPLTDLHTHLSAQVSGRDLIAMGLEANHEALYPTAALAMLGIDYPRQGLVQIQKRLFLPLAHLQTSRDGTEEAVALSRLSPAALERLCAALSLPAETQSTFERFEHCYYLREPFTKDIRLLPAMLRKAAENYREQGVLYAEMSSNAVLEPAWLKIIHEVMPEIERACGVRLRFRAGLPRNLGEAALSARIEQYKRIAMSPYVAGPDILGYEVNKTSHLETHLDALLGWMRERQPEASIQIHAGENSKNPDNVKEALRLGLKHHIRVMIGHSLYGIDEETMELAVRAAKANGVIVQFLLDSNLAGNNIDFPQDATIAQFLDAGVPSVLASDGAALYLTSAPQIALSGLFCGVSPAGFRAIRRTEETYIEEQRKIFAVKQAALGEEDFFRTLSLPAPAHQKATPPIPFSEETTPQLQRLIDSGRPVFFAGAGGSSWKEIPAAGKDAIIQGISLLLEKLDPEKVYFLKGRTKVAGGVNIELEKAVDAYNAVHERKFALVTLLVESDGIATEPAQHHHTLRLPLPLINLPSAVTGFLMQHKGCAFYIGGRKFTRDFILESVQKSVPFGLMRNIPGASQEKARIYGGHAYEGAQGLLQWAADMHILKL